MKLPRKGILIRLVIYVPLMLYFGYYAVQNLFCAPPDAATPPAEPRKIKITRPDGTSVEFTEIEMSEDQARQLGYDRGKPGGEAEAKAPAAGDAKSPAAPPEGAN